VIAGDPRLRLDASAMEMGEDQKTMIDRAVYLRGSSLIFLLGVGYERGHGYQVL